jgi:hypothetical protein
MTQASRIAPARYAPRVTSTAPLLYWLLIVSALFAFAVVHRAPLDQVLPLAGGSLLGTGLGQLFARARFRLWLVGLTLMAFLWCTFFLVAGLRDDIGGGDGSWLALMACAPAIACGYLASGERTAVVAFWFPVALWMPTIASGADGLAALDEDHGISRWGLALLGALFLGFLRARETRRVALWRRVGAVRLATPSAPRVLRRSPVRALVQTTWAGAAAALAFVATAWVAPLLWQTEPLPPAAAPTPAPVEPTAANPQPDTTWAAPASPSNATFSPQVAVDIPCCPPPHHEAPRERVHEYFPLMEPHAVPGETASTNTGCKVCQNIASSASIAVAPSIGPQAEGPGTLSAFAPIAAVPPCTTAPSIAKVPSGPAPASPPTSSGVSTGVAAVQTPKAIGGHTQGPVAPVPVPPAPAPVSTPSLSVDPPFATHVSHLHAKDPKAQPEETPPWSRWVQWALLVPALGIVLELALRPLRRLVTLRHLRSGLWTESVDQRVSNLWHLVLVGLRDAGWRAARGEEPQALARRIALPGIASCALVLERARHGVRVDAEDLETMGRDAGAVYGEARRRAGGLGRIAAWLRWPLV